MKKYIAIGNWDWSENVTCVVGMYNTLHEFREELKLNGFMSYIILTEKRFEKMDGMSGFEILEELIHSVSGRRLNIVVDYIEQCYDIMMEKMEEAE